MFQSFPENPDEVVTKKILYNLSSEVTQTVLKTIDIISKDIKKEIFLENKRINQLEKRLAKIEEKQ